MAGLVRIFKDKDANRNFICLVSNEKDTQNLGDLLGKFDSHVTTSSSDFDKLVEKQNNITLVLLCSQDDMSTVCKRLSYIREKHPCAFIVVADKTICNDADSRIQVVECGANMVTELDNNELLKAMDMVAQLGREKGPFECPYCHAKGFTQHDLWLHCPLYHINVSNDTVLKSAKCPICSHVSQAPMMVRYIKTVSNYIPCVVRCTFMRIMGHLKEKCMVDLTSTPLH